MSTIDLKLKSYDELLFELTTLNTNNYLLQQKVEQLEKEKNSLMYSLTLVRQKWNNDKAKYRRKAKVYREQRNQLENIRKEAIEYVSTHDYPSYFGFSEKDLSKSDLLNILNKGSDKE